MADRWLATVTRLPVAPLMAGPDVPELPEDFDQLCAEELLAAPEPSPMFAAAAPVDTAAPASPPVTWPTGSCSWACRPSCSAAPSGPTSPSSAPTPR